MASRGVIWGSLAGVVALCFCVRLPNGPSLLGAPGHSPAPTAAVVAAPDPAPPTPSAAVLVTPPALSQERAPDAMALRPESAPDDTPLLPPGWAETPSRVERPVVTLHNEIGEEGRVVMLLSGQSEDYQLDVSQGTASQEISSGQYRYEIRGGYFRRTGQPDQYGVIRCRRFRNYELTLRAVPDDTPFRVDLGDR